MLYCCTVDRLSVEPLHSKGFRTTQCLVRVGSQCAAIQVLSRQHFLELIKCICTAGIAPDWDDPHIQHGGLWLAHSSDVVVRDPDSPLGGYTLHDAWMDTVMHVIGEQFPDSHHVAGVALNIRKNGSRLSLWTRAAKNEAAEKVQTPVTSMH